MTEIRGPLPLTAEEAFWHACSGVPYEEQMVPLVYDPYCVAGECYMLNPEMQRRFNEELMAGQKWLQERWLKELR